MKESDGSVEVPKRLLFFNVEHKSGKVLGRGGPCMESATKYAHYWAHGDIPTRLVPMAGAGGVWTSEWQWLVHTEFMVQYLCGSQ
jgi:hypothetical protein